MGTRAKDLPNTMSTFTDADYGWADEDSSGETKKFNRATLVAGLDSVLMKRTVLADQTEADPEGTEEIVHDITSYGFVSAPLVLLTIKSTWGVYVKTVTASTVTLGINPSGEGTIKYDLIMLYF